MIVTGDPGFPERVAHTVARELGLPVATHAGVWGATNDDSGPRGSLSPREIAALARLNRSDLSQG